MAERQFEVRMSLAVIHGDSEQNEHIHGLGLLLGPQDTVIESLHMNSHTGSTWALFPQTLWQNCLYAFCVRACVMRGTVFVSTRGLF